MIGAKDIIELLDKVPLWKRLKEAPDKIQALEQRVTTLEKLLEKVPGDSCPACGERQMRRTFSSPPIKGGTQRNETWVCETCKSEEQRVVTF